MKKNIHELGYEWFDKMYDGDRDHLANDYELGFVIIDEEGFNTCKNQGMVLLDKYGNEIKHFDEIE